MGAGEGKGEREEKKGVNQPAGGEVDDGEEGVFMFLEVQQVD